MLDLIAQATPVIVPVDSTCYGDDCDLTMHGAIVATIVTVTVCLVAMFVVAPLLDRFDEDCAEASFVLGVGFLIFTGCCWLIAGLATLVEAVI